MKPVYIHGLSAWAPGRPSLDHLRDDRSAIEEPPACTWVPSRLLRGASRLTRMLCEVAAQATTAARMDPSSVHTVYTSGYGEIETMVTLLDSIVRGDGQLSPMRFKNSVHNAASGLGSIGQANAAFSTALAGGPRSFEAAILEAAALLHERDGDVIIACGDDQVPEPLASLDTRASLAVGVALSTRADGALAVMTRLTWEATPTEVTTLFGRPAPSSLRATPAFAAAPWLEAVLAGAQAAVPLAPGVPASYVAHLAPRPAHDGGPADHGS